MVVVPLGIASDSESAVLENSLATLLGSSPIDVRTPTIEGGVSLASVGGGGCLAVVGGGCLAVISGGCLAVMGGGCLVEKEASSRRRSPPSPLCFISPSLGSSFGVMMPTSGSAANPRIASAVPLYLLSADQWDDVGDRLASRRCSTEAVKADSAAEDCRFDEM